MSYLALQNFKFGLDTRRSELTSQPGTLAIARNGHINQGGEFEKRKAFVKLASYPTTFGLQEIASGLAVFGSVADPGVASPFVYVRCQHPDGVSAMTNIVSSTNYAGKAFCIALFDNGSIITFYDGVMVDDLSPGRLAVIYADANSLAEYFASLVNSITGFTATASGGVVTVTNTQGQSFVLVSENNSLCTNTPDVSGKNVTACVLTVTADTLYLYYDAYYSNDISTFPGTETALGALHLGAGHDLVVDLKALADAVPVAMTGGTNHGLIFNLSGGIGPGPTGTWNATVTTTYSDGTVTTYSWGVLTYPSTGEPAVLVKDEFMWVAPTVDDTRTTSLVSQEDGTAPRGQFTLVAFEAAVGGDVTNVIIDQGGANETEILGASVAMGATLNITASAIKDQINTYCVANGLHFTADVQDNVVFITATQDYATWNNKSVTIVVTDAVCIGQCQILIAQLPGSATIPTVTAVNVDGTNVMLSASITGTSLSDLCVNLAADIRSKALYTAAAVGSAVYVSKFTTSSGDVVLDTVVVLSDGNSTGGDTPSISATTSPVNLTTDSTSGGYTRSIDTTVSVVGGTPPFTYAWEYVSGNMHIIVRNGTNQTTNFAATSLYVADNSPVTAVWRCKITDSTGVSTYTNTVQIILTKTTPTR